MPKASENFRKLPKLSKVFRKILKGNPSFFDDCRDDPRSSEDNQRSSKVLDDMLRLNCTKLKLKSVHRKPPPKIIEEHQIPFKLKRLKE